jgi:predicted TIM-barrel fold metal-dependent hydrolase
MYRAYNDFCLELSAVASTRFVYLPNLPSAQPHLCLAELRRVADRGARAVELSMYDLGSPLHEPVWEPLWTEAEERGLVICSHTGHGAGKPFPPKEHGLAHVHHSTSPFVAARPIAEMVFGGVFERHPRLLWIMAESRIGWLPFFVSWMDRQVSIRDAGPVDSLSRLPSEYVQQNVRVTFEDDVVGGHLLHEPWAHLQEIVLWGCDYPHPQGVWPDPDPVVERMLHGLDPTLREEIVFGRAARIFGIGAP